MKSSKLLLLLLFSVSLADSQEAVTSFVDTTICRYGLNKFLQDNSNLYDTITFPMQNYQLGDLAVKIDTFTHTWDADVRMYIRHNSIGTRFINWAGGSGDNFIRTNINDSSSLCPIGSPSCNTPPFTGSFRPAVGGSFAGYINQNLFGTWILHMTDSALGDTGTLKAWCLTFRIVFDGLNNHENIIPQKYHLEQNYPNPFNPTTIIKYGLPKAGNVKFAVYDITGSEVAVLVDEHKSAGTYNIGFDASSLSSGVYFYKVTAGDYAETKKMVLIK